MGLEAAATEYGARIIAIDRPGLGWSSPQPNRTILDHARDVELITDHLDIHEFGILGISGGGPYALACAKALPASRLQAVSIMCGLGPPDMGYRGTNLVQHISFAFVLRYFPSFVAWYISFDPAARLDLSDQERYQRMRALMLSSKQHEKDKPFMDDLDLMRQSLKVTREAYGQGMQHYARDGQLIVNDWGFKIEEIRKTLPVRLWCGKLDTNVPPFHGEEIARRLGENAVLRMEDETHASLYVNCRADMVRDLIECMRKAL